MRTHSPLRAALAIGLGLLAMAGIGIAILAPNPVHASPLPSGCVVMAEFDSVPDKAVVTGPDATELARLFTDGLSANPAFHLEKVTAVVVLTGLPGQVNAVFFEGPRACSSVGWPTADAYAVLNRVLGGVPAEVQQQGRGI